MDYPEWISIIYELQKSWLCSNMLILWSDSAFHSRVETQVQDILTMTLYKILNARSCFSSVQSLSCVRLFAAPWIAACQAFLSITSSWSLLKLKSIESVMPSNHLILCRPLLLLHPITPSIGSFPMNQLFTWGGQSTGVLVSVSVHPMNTQDWSPWGWTGWTSCQSKGLSRVFSNTTGQKHQFFYAQVSPQSNSHIHTWPLEKP